MPSHRLAGTVDRSEWLKRYPRLTQPQVDLVAAALLDALGEEVVVADHDSLLAYSYDATGERYWPDLAILPRTVNEVSQAVAIARRHRMPIIGRGASTNLSGGTTPLVGGLVISFVRMNRILEVDTVGRWCRVEPGVVNADLAEALNALGYFYPPDPSSHRISTIGGNVAENSGGPHCVKYGVTTHHVLALKGVLANGHPIELAPVGGGTVDGVDLAGLLVGSEGTLALVTEATLAIQPLPHGTATALVVFSRLEDAVAAVSGIVAAGVEPSALEVMDRDSLRVVEQFVHAGYPADAGAVLLIEVDGGEALIDSKMRTARMLCQTHQAQDFRVAATPAAAESLWRGRRAHYGATARLAPHLWVQDVTVPRPQLARMIHRVMAIGQEQRLTILTAAHAGDGNLHPNIPYDPANLDQVRRLKAADRAILAACVELGGSITGEHGIGIDKAEHLPLMYSPWELEVMSEIKAAFDPQGLLNPLKALWPPGSLPPPRAVPEAPPVQVESVEQLQDAMLWSRAKGQPVSIRGHNRRSGVPVTRWVLTSQGFRRVRDLDQDNFSVEVDAGIPAGLLARTLAAEGLDVPGLEPFMDDTVGGLIAANAPFWRHSAGHGWRDWLLAAQWVDGRGRLLRYGRKTVKNVAGYDLAKLMVGSQGRLGFLTQVILRAQPRRERVVIAVSDTMEPAQGESVAARLLASPDAPEGLLLVKRPGELGVAIWAVAHRGTGTLREQLYATGDADWLLNEGEDAWLDLEQGRLREVYQAHSAGQYRSGRIPLGEVAAPIFSHDGWVFVCPTSRRFEVLGAGGHRWLDQTATDSQVARLRERVARIFDPEQLLR